MDGGVSEGARRARRRAREKEARDGRGETGARTERSGVDEFLRHRAHALDDALHRGRLLRGDRVDQRLRGVPGERHRRIGELPAPELRGEVIERGVDARLPGAAHDATCLPKENPEISRCAARPSHSRPTRMRARPGALAFWPGRVEARIGRISLVTRWDVPVGLDKSSQ